MNDETTVTPTRRYRVSNARTGADLGVFDASTPAEALEELRRAAGYDGSAHAAEVLGVTLAALDAELHVRLVEGAP